MFNENIVNYMVHNVRKETIDFRGTYKECKEYIKENNSISFPLELYTAIPGDKHYKVNSTKSNNECEEDVNIEMW